MNVRKDPEKSDVEKAWVGVVKLSIKASRLTYAFAGVRTPFIELNTALDALDNVVKSVRSPLFRHAPPVRRRITEVVNDAEGDVDDCAPPDQVKDLVHEVNRIMAGLGCLDAEWGLDDE